MATRLVVPLDGAPYEEEWEQDVSQFVPAPVTNVSARQFKLQLLAAGLLDTVDAWVAAQSREIRIAYEYSGTFVKESPMMTAGFQAMGFTGPQIDAFFEAAAKL